MGVVDGHGGALRTGLDAIAQAGEITGAPVLGLDVANALVEVVQFELLAGGQRATTRPLRVLKAAVQVVVQLIALTDQLIQKSHGITAFSAGEMDTQFQELESSNAAQGLG
jgi:hypothetical protein